MPSTHLARLAATAAATLAVVACGDDGDANTDSPIATIESQASALRDGDCEKALELTVAPNAAAQDDCEAQTGEGLDIEIVDSEITDESADETQVDVTYEIDGEEQQRSIRLELVDDAWLID